MQFFWEIGQEKELPQKEGGPCQRAIRRAGLGPEFLGAGRGRPGAGRWKVIQTKVLRRLSKAKGHKQGPKPDTASDRASGPSCVRMELGTSGRHQAKSKAKVHWSLVREWGVLTQHLDSVQS